MTFASRFMGQALKLPPPSARDVDVERDLRVPMPDGAVLLADRYVPRGADRPPLLTYTSAPLAGDLTLMGEVTAELRVASSREHTDFFARLCDVDASGASLNICDALVRLAPGRPERQPDGTIRARFTLWPTAHLFRRGHRLRLQVSSGAHPRYARNTGPGEPLATATTLARADQQVFHDPGHPSAIILPVAPG
jgi:uncharacterized protein